MPEDSLLSDLCTICHIQTPKYRCPRCSTRTCSLPCSTRHKTWSQCSGVRDPAAYVRRNELATESAFDRDFNFITGIERGLERAERDVENRGIPLQTQGQGQGLGGAENEEDDAARGGQTKRRRVNGPGAGSRSGAGLAKGEAGFLRGAENAGVTVIRAPKGMSRNKMNGSRWNTRHKCLHWTVEWITAGGESKTQYAMGDSTIAGAFDRVFPVPKEEREKNAKEDNADGIETEMQESTQPQPQPQPHTSQPEATKTTNQDEQSASNQPKQPPPEEAEKDEPNQTTILPHRSTYFYLHRPRTPTKYPVIIPLHPSTTLASALRGRTVLELPTIYALPAQPGAYLHSEDSASAPHVDSEEGPKEKQQQNKFILEEEYLRTHPEDNQTALSPKDDKNDEEIDDVNGYDFPEKGEAQPADMGADIPEDARQKVLDAIAKDFFEG